MRWVVGGRVQGVGFRPFVCRLANETGVNGSVRNYGGRVEIVGQHPRFIERLLSEHPATARPELLSAEPCEDPPAGFRILASEGANIGAVLLPDQSACDPCLAEMVDPNARRHRYPFITCTQCGPRYTITAAHPFDRAHTAMAGFPLCAECRREYDRPADRRFHAQGMSCPACGPGLQYKAGPHSVFGNDAALVQTVAALHDGKIVATRGIGGYHLLCDAGNDAAVRRLRTRKQRPTKPFAVLFPRTGADGLDMLRRYCAPDPEEALSLCAPERPIVLVRLRDSHLSQALAPGLCELGAMLPCSPLHALIAEAFAGPLVATSGNVSGEPVLTDPTEAEHHMGAVADAFLHHDRPILRPADDGVVKVMAGRARNLRLGRGSAPLELVLPRPVNVPVLALGGQMKVTLALAFGDRVVISPHLGELDSPRGLALLEATAEAFQHLHGVRAEVLACDAHRGITSARWARAQGLPMRRVHHHHAHAAALAGEYPQEPRWLCFTWDGVGLGEDGTLWGGEALLGRPGSWTRVATFRPFAPPGGDRAARAPWRSAAALAWELGIDWIPPGIDLVLSRAAWQQRLNCPQTSSVGRLFDAASAFLNLVQTASHEGEGPMAVEAIAADCGDAVSLPMRRRDDEVWQTDWAPLVTMLCDDRVPRSRRAAMFHASLARALVGQAIAAREQHGSFAIGLAGGVFQNRRLSEQSLRALEVAGFRAHLPAAIPCNDSGLSYGQVIEAVARQ